MAVENKNHRRIAIGCLSLIVAGVLLTGISKTVQEIPGLGYVLIIAAVVWLAAVTLGRVEAVRSRFPFIRTFAKQNLLVAITLSLIVVAGATAGLEQTKQSQIQAARKKLEAEENARRAREEAARKAAADTKLRASASSRSVQFREDLDVIEALMTANKYEDAQTKIDALSKEIAPFEELKPIPAEISSIIIARDDVSKRLKPVANILAAIHDLDTYKEQAELMSNPSNSSGWDALRETYQKALKQVSTLENADREIKRLIPKKLNLKRERTSIEKKIAKAEKAFTKSKQAEEAKKAYLLLCGEKPFCSGGECVGIEPAIRRTAHDPDSIDVSNCTPVRITDDNCWVTMCDVRGKNVYGGLVLNRKAFSISTLGVSELR